MAPTVSLAPIKATHSDTASNTSKSTVGVALKSVQPYQQRTFKCTYDWCEHRFETEKEMKQHKKVAEDHYYCKKCDVDCEDWQSLTNHKVEVMAPYVEGRKKPTEEDPPKHITCEFCGEDFRSFGGRKRHRAQRHPADQDIDCPGCSMNFIRAANMVEHLEKGHCTRIRASEFKASIQQKYMAQQIMVNHDHVITELDNNVTGLSKRRGLITQGTETDNGDNSDGEEDGGVDILSRDDEDQFGGHEPLQPDVDLMSQEASQAGESTWPSLSGKGVSDLADSVSGMSMGAASDDETASQYTTSTKRTAWKSQSSSKKLFPDAKPTSPDYQAIVQLRKQNQAAEEENNILKARIWDPASPAYREDRFLDRAINKYCCPLPACAQDNITCDTPSDLVEHFRTVHTKTIYSCPACFKRYQTVTALVAHAESTSKCGIRGSNNYKRFISEITGGYLESKEMHVPKIYKPSTDVVKAGQSKGGVMSNKYIGTKPEW